jgi:hypothetical protein
MNKLNRRIFEFRCTEERRELHSVTKDKKRLYSSNTILSISQAPRSDRKSIIPSIRQSAGRPAVSHRMYALPACLPACLPSASALAGIFGLCVLLRQYIPPLTFILYLCCRPSIVPAYLLASIFCLPRPASVCLPGMGRG